MEIKLGAYTFKNRRTDDAQWEKDGIECSIFKDGEEIGFVVDSGVAMTFTVVIEDPETQKDFIGVLEENNIKLSEKFEDNYNENSLHMYLSYVLDQLYVNNEL